MPAWSVPPLWCGASVHVIGGGPSLRGTDPARFAGRRLIAVNNAWEISPPAEILFFGDWRWWRWNAAAVRAGYRGTIVTTARQGRADPALNCLDRASRDGLSDDPAALCGLSSGHLAINLAALGGAARIVLHGFDMRRAADGRHHFHSRHLTPTPDDIYERTFIPALEAIAPALAARGIEVLNATPDSALTCFPTIDPEDLPCDT